jgi:hypothetical protein
MPVKVEDEAAVQGITDSRRLRWLLVFMELSGGMSVSSTLDMVDDSLRLGTTPAEAIGIASQMRQRRARPRNSPPHRGEYRK